MCTFKKNKEKLHFIINNLVSRQPPPRQEIEAKVLNSDLVSFITFVSFV